MTTKVRKTAAERRAEAEAKRAAEQAQLDAERSVEYVPRLMAALERATDMFYYELVVRDNKFILRDTNRKDYYARSAETALAPTYSREDYINLEDLEYELNARAREREEELRKEEVRKAALNKLTDEERAVLGL